MEASGVECRVSPEDSPTIYPFLSPLPPGNFPSTLPLTDSLLSDNLIPPLLSLSDSVLCQFSLWFPLSLQYQSQFI